MKRIGILLIISLFSLQFGFATDYYVSLSGNDANGDGSSGRPWRTLQHAVSRVPANQGHTIKILAGTFVENGYINVPAGVNIDGAGIGVTIIKPGPSLTFKSGAWDFQNYLIRLIGGGAGNQTVKNFTLDGISKQLYGGLIVKDRTHVLVQRIRVQYFYFTGIWIHGSADTRVTEVQLKDNAWGGGAGSSGSIILGESERLEVDHLTVDEKYGQALDAVNGKMYDLKIHDNHFSVNPKGQWVDQNGNVPPNLCVELFGAELKNVQIYDNYFDNTLSLVMFTAPNGIPTVRVYNNVFDMIARAGGAGYGIELTANDAEIDHNYFRGGSNGIVNWEYSYRPAKQNWKIHHNTFHGIASGYPTAVITFYQNGINGAHIYNNTVEMTGTATVSFIEANYTGVVKNMTVENNLIIDSNTGYQWHPNKFISLNNVTAESSTVRNNFVQKMPIGSVAGVTYSNNLSGDPQIQRSGAQPAPYYIPNAGSPLIDAGTKLNFTYNGSAPDIGAHEFGGSGSVTRPKISITKPLSNSIFTEGDVINISADATSPANTISKVEFFQGTTKLGEDNTSPYTFNWTNATPGGYSITARATDSAGETGTSSQVNIKVNGVFAIPGIIQAEHYSNMSGVQTEATTDTGGGENAGWIETGDWIDYTVKVATAGNYTVQYRVSSETTGGTIELRTGEKVLAASDFQASGGWQTWTTVTQNVSLPAGTQTLRLFAKKGGWNINWLDFKNTSANTPPVVAIAQPVDKATFPASSDITLQANASDNSKVNQVQFYNGSTLLGTDTSSPYSFTWQNVPAGVYAITAKATDDSGETTTSPVVNINVKATLSLTIPGTIQAEDYAEMSGVDLENTTDEGGGKNVGWFAVGDWIDYQVNVTAAGEYIVKFRASSLGSGGTVELRDGATTLSTTPIPPTAGWQTWTTVEATVNLKAGDQTLRLYASKGAINLNWISFAAKPVQSAVQIPGIVEAEAYDNMSGIQLEVTTDTGGGKNVGWIEQGDWLDYSVDVSTAGTYDIEFRVASLSGGGSLDLLSGTTKLSTSAITATGAWQSWSTVKTTATLTSGRQTIRLYAAQGGFNLNWIKFSVRNNAISIPGIVEAESFVKMNGIQSQPTEDIGGGLNVGWIDPGDWMDHVVNVTEAGTYTVKFRVSSEMVGALIQLKSGSAVLCEAVAPVTGGWQNWTTVYGSLKLEAGLQTLTFHTVDGALNINWIEFIPAESNGVVDIPGLIEAEKYTTMSGIQLEETTDTGGGLYNGWIETGDWMEYEVNIASAGTYAIEYRVASLPGNAKIELKSGATTLTTTDIPSTGSWQKWTTVGAVANLPAGTHTLRFYAGVGGFNVNWIRFSSTSGIDASSTLSSSLTRIFSPNNDGINDTWEWSTDETKECKCSIFDQQGKKVYEGISSQQTTWDGTANGQPLQTEAFYYIIECGDAQTTGAVQIVR